MHLLSAEAVSVALPYALLIPAVADAMMAVSAGRTELPLRRLQPLGEFGGVGMMAGSWPDHGASTVKLVAFPHRRSAASHGGVIVLFDGAALDPIAVLEADTVTARRTAAASAVATDALSRPDARILAILGTGTQAAAHAEALRHVRPLTEIRVWGRDHRRAAALAATVTDGRAVESIAAAVAGADIVCTVTSAAEPFLMGDLLDPGTHVNLVGSSSADRREADDRVIERGRLFVDFRGSALDQAGELRGRFGAERIIAEIGEVLAGHPGRASEAEITLYKSLGVAAQDIAAATLALAEARRRGLGVSAAW